MIPRDSIPIRPNQRPRGRYYCSVLMQWNSCNDAAEAIADGHWRLGDGEEVSFLLSIWA